MPPRTLPAYSYGIVCVALLCGTILTTGLSFLHVAPVWHTVIGLGIALAQATIIVLFSMHLVLANKVTWSVVLVVCFWLGIMLVLTLTDYFTRGLVPYAPGH
jgi:cytochrome c oxidase subunit IV